MDKLIQTLKNHIWLLIITIIGLGLRIQAIIADPFLHPWDERYHALVAKNMMEHPFKPMLYAHPLTNYNYINWSGNHIWLHKQPLFLWQMALSMKLFGVSEWAMRLPSAIMGTLQILLIYRICMLLTRNKVSALLSALLMCGSYYHLEVISGRRGMDHNDMAFCFYVTASIWSYCEYIRAPKWYWALLTGFLSGCAILTKWLVGLLVFSAWGISTLIALFRKDFGKLWHLLGALLLCCMVFVPWQVYIFQAFPREALYEWTYNAKHLLKAVEGHSGDPDYYYVMFPSYFTQGLWRFLFVGIAIVLFRAIRGTERQLGLTLVFYCGVVYVFFALVAATKLDGYMMPVTPLGHMFIAVFLSAVLSMFRYRKGLVVLVAVMCVYYCLDVKEDPYLADPHRRAVNIYNATLYKQIDQMVPDSVQVICNYAYFDDAQVMFYSKRTAYSHPNPEEIKALRDQHVPIAIFKNIMYEQTPSELNEYPYLFVIDRQIVK